MPAENECDHQWILPRYFEAQHRNSGLVTGTCIKCRYRLREAIECWSERLGEIVRSTSAAGQMVDKRMPNQVVPSFVEQLGRKFRVAP